MGGREREGKYMYYINVRSIGMSGDTSGSEKQLASQFRVYLPHLTSYTNN